MKRTVDLTRVRWLGLATLSLATGCAPFTPDAQMVSSLAALDVWQLEEGIDAVRAAAIDLNGTGGDEYVVLASDPRYCGSGGCALFVLSAEGGPLRTISRSTITRPPIRALATRTLGWRDLVVRIGGGGMATRDVVLRWNGQSYPLNPSLAPTQEEPSPGETVLGPD